MPNISHQPTDRDKAPWKAAALFALFAIWLLSGWLGRDPWKPDEPKYIGILYEMLTQGNWWSAQVGDVLLPSETPFIHWLNAAITWLPRQFLPLHEAARLASVFWVAIAALSIALAARRWSGGHISYLAAVIFFGCLGLYDRAHAYVPETALLAAIAMSLYAASELAERSHRATALFTLAGVLGFMAHGALGVSLIAAPLLLLAFAPVFAMHRLALFRAFSFVLLLAGLLTFAFAQRSPEAFAAWFSAGAGLSLEDRQHFGPHQYLITLGWFAWPAWPIAVWTLVLRGRGFAGGWARAEIIAPTVWLAASFVLLNALAEQRTIYSLFLLPSFVLLAAFGVDTVRRTWYALIDWFGILVLGLTALAIFLVSLALYLKWPPNMGMWAEKFVPDFKADLPWFGYIVALIAFLIWIALVQPAHQHARRALINWLGCVTFIWVVAQALLIAPANHHMSMRSVLAPMNKLWPNSGCVEALETPTSHVAMLDYMLKRRVQPIDDIDESKCDHIFFVRERKADEVPDLSAFEVIFSANRPGDRSEKLELLRRKTPLQESKP